MDNIRRVLGANKEFGSNPAARSKQNLQKEARRGKETSGATTGTRGDTICFAERLSMESNPAGIRCGKQYPRVFSAVAGSGIF